MITNFDYLKKIQNFQDLQMLPSRQKRLYSWIRKPVFLIAEERWNLQSSGCIL